MEVIKWRLINKRNKDITYIYPELANLHSFVKQKCIIDGEIVIMNQGKPDFYRLQKRSLLTNSLKISLAQKKNPAIFVVFALRQAVFLGLRDDKIASDLKNN